MLADKRLFLLGNFGFLFLFFISQATPGNAAPFYEGKTLVMVQGDAPHYLNFNIPLSALPAKTVVSTTVLLFQSFAEILFRLFDRNP